MGKVEPTGPVQCCIVSPVRSLLVASIGVAILTLIACTPQAARQERRESDSNRNGRNDTFTYWEGFQVVRIEIDRDEDGKIDTWEHYDANSKLVRIGSSSRDDATADTWSYPDQSGLLQRVEFDADRDGKIDKRELYTPRPESPHQRVVSVVELEIDAAGKPRRRIYYRADGSFDRSELVR